MRFVKRKVFSKMLTSTQSSRGQAKREREVEDVENSEKDRLCLTKMAIPPPACESSGKRETDRDWVQSDHERRVFKTLINKEELRLASWIQIRLTEKRDKMKKFTFLARRPPVFQWKTLKQSGEKVGVEEEMEKS